MNRRPSPDPDPAVWLVTLERPNGHVRLVGGAPSGPDARNLAEDERTGRVRRAFADRDRPWTRDDDGVWWAELTDRRVFVCYPPPMFRCLNGSPECPNIVIHPGESCPSHAPIAWPCHPGWFPLEEGK